MKGQTRLDNCLDNKCLTTGTRFLYRKGAGNGPLFEGKVKEIVTDDDDSGQRYIRMDDSGEWQAPNAIFVEYIFGQHKAKPVPAAPAHPPQTAAERRADSHPTTAAERRSETHPTTAAERRADARGE